MGLLVWWLAWVGPAVASELELLLALALALAQAQSLVLVLAEPVQEVQGAGGFPKAAEADGMAWGCGGSGTVS